MARPKSKGKKEDSELDEKHPLDASIEESEVESSEEAIAEEPKEIAAPVVEESKKISGSPLGKVRGKDLKNY